MLKPSITFSPMSAPTAGVLVLLAGDNGSLPASAPAEFADLLAKAVRVGKFKGKNLSGVEATPAASDLDRIVVVGTRSEVPYANDDWLKLGGAIAGKVKGVEAVTIWGERPNGGALQPREAAELALGFLLRSYSFDRYKSKKKSGSAADEDEPAETSTAVTVAVADPDSCRAAFVATEAVGQGVALARDLVNEPANVLTTVEYAKRVGALTEVGLDVEILDETKMRELKMLALLGVAQGSPTPPRLCIMRWNGGPEGEAPVAFVGKGVVFDTGGISIKPAAGMEDMKGDMGGSAAVVGTMVALAGRKARVNAVGIIGIVENAVDGNAQRPGDIVTAMSGTTIEVLNTDAEGRLVLADALWYCQDRFKPKFMVNLATLTGAIIVALGNTYAGLFSNNDDLSARLMSAGTATGEKVWRMPLAKEYDKMIEGKVGDIKNIGGGRAAGSITAAQFLQRFVNDVPWAHLDVAGTAMGSPANEYNQSWASGFGVRLLNRLVEDHYESGGAAA